VNVYLSPTLNFHNEAFRYAISIDDESPKLVNIYGDQPVQDGIIPRYGMRAVSNNIRVLTSRHLLKTPGSHTLKFWLVDSRCCIAKNCYWNNRRKTELFGTAAKLFCSSVKMKSQLISGALWSITSYSLHYFCHLFRYPRSIRKER